MDDSVPVHQDEAHNAVLRTWGDDKKAGNTGYGVFLNQALINYGLEFLWTRGNSDSLQLLLITDSIYAIPQINLHISSTVTKWPEPPNFPISTKNSTESSKVPESADTDKYLIATRELPLSCAHASEWLQPNQLPIKYAGSSTCFRKEAGSQGRDAWGTFRVHQFEKVEQFIYCQPADSFRHLEEMLTASEEFY